MCKVIIGGDNIARASMFQMKTDLMPVVLQPEFKFLVSAMGKASQ